MTDVIRQTIKHEGVRGLYKVSTRAMLMSTNGILPQGVLPNMMKLAPAAGVSWFVFEEVKMFLGIDVRS